nr:protein patronus 1-like [Tanacetum cinerariifolium]
MAMHASRMTQDQNFSVHFDGATINRSSVKKNKGGLGGRKALNDISNSAKPSALQPLRIQNLKNVLPIGEDVGVGKKPLAKAPASGRKALGDLTNMVKPFGQQQDLKKKSQVKQSLTIAEDAPYSIAEEGFRHNHDECVKQQKNVSFDDFNEFLYAIGHENDPLFQSVSTVCKLLPVKPKEDNSFMIFEMEEIAEDQAFCFPICRSPPKSPKMPSMSFLNYETDFILVGVGKICSNFKTGVVYAVEISPRSSRDLVNMASKRTNVIPIIKDSRAPAKYRMLVGMVDVIFFDVAQPDQFQKMAMHASRMTQDQNFSVHFDGATINRSSVKKNKGGLGGRKALNDISNSAKPSALQPLRIHNLKNVLPIGEDVGVGKKPLAKAPASRRKALGDLTNMVKPFGQQQGLKKTSQVKQSLTIAEDAPYSIAEEGFRHNHDECVKQQKNVSFDDFNEFLHAIGHENDPLFQSVSTVCKLLPVKPKTGVVYAVEISPRSSRDLVNMASKRTNVIPIIKDSRAPAKYRMLVGMVDVIFFDVAQPDQ